MCVMCPNLVTIVTSTAAYSSVFPFFWMAVSIPFFVILTTCSGLHLCQAEGLQLPNHLSFLFHRNDLNHTGFMLRIKVLGQQQFVVEYR